MDEIFESENLERELNDPASVDPRVSVARRVTRLAASSGVSHRDLLADARDRATSTTSGAFGAAARRTMLVAASVLALGGTTVAMAAHDAAPGSFLHPIRQVGHAVLTLVTGGDDAVVDDETDDDEITSTDEPTLEPTATPTGSVDDDELGEHENRGHGNNADHDDADNPGRSHDDDDDDEADDPGRGQDDDADDDEAGEHPNRGHGNNADDDDAGNPGSGEDDDHRADDDREGSDNSGHGEEDDGDEGHGSDD